MSEPVGHAAVAALARAAQPRLRRARDRARLPVVAAGQAPISLPAEAGGRYEVFAFDSDALRGNPLGDPSARTTAVYLPPAYDAEPERRFPSLYVTHGFTGMVERHWNVEAYQRSFPELVAARFAGPGQAPAIVVFVDGWSALGGGQFLDSPAVGSYQRWLCDDAVGEVDRRYRTLAGAAHRGIAGESSGGYGAIVSALLRPELFGGVASHAGDALFEVQFLPLFPEAARALRDGYGGSFERFFADFFGRPAFTRAADGLLLELYAMAACFSADGADRIRFPFDLATGRLVPEVWARWRALDPVRLVESRPAAARGLRAVWLDAGRSDDYHLDLGAEALRRALVAAGAPEPRFELIDADHRSWLLDYRYPAALGWLAERLGPTG